MYKIQREYVLKAQDRNLSMVEIKDLHINFLIKKNVKGGGNDSLFTVKNLSQTTRDNLRRDKMEADNQRLLSFSAGYGTTGIYELFQGNIFYCRNYRQGVDIHTDFSCICGGDGIKNSIFSNSYAAGIKQGIIIEDVLKELAKYGIAKGEIDPELYGRTINIDKAINLKTMEALKFKGYNTYIDDNRLNIIKQDKYITENNIIINQIIGSPIKYDLNIEVKTIFEPSPKLGQSIQLESHVERSLNGKYKVVGLTHQGGIADMGNAGECATTIEAQAITA
jgi:hypothetical protein